MRGLLVCFLMLMVAGCASSSVEKSYRGLYVYGHEVHSFTPCGDKTDFWVSFDWAGMEMHDFYQQAEKSISQPIHQTMYQPMYIEFRGQVLNEKVDGFAEDYDGLIRISEVFSYTFELPASC